MKLYLQEQVQSYIIAQLRGMRGLDPKLTVTDMVSAPTMRALGTTNSHAASAFKRLTRLGLLERVSYNVGQTRWAYKLAGELPPIAKGLYTTIQAPTLTETFAELCQKAEKVEKVPEDSPAELAITWERTTRTLGFTVENLRITIAIL